MHKNPKKLTAQNFINGFLLSFLITGFLEAGGIRDHTRPTYEHGTRISQPQATDLTLTLVKTEPQNLQTWIRLAGVINDDGQTLSAELCTPDATLIKPGQRVRVFPPDSKSSIYSARISRLNWQKNCLIFSAHLSTTHMPKKRAYVMEILISRGQFMAVPKEAILEEGDQKIVYLQRHQGHFFPQRIHTGLKGELYTQVLSGLNEGDKVATFGSFFIDAEYKLKSAKPLSDSSGKPHAHHHH